MKGSSVVEEDMEELEAEVLGDAGGGVYDEREAVGVYVPEGLVP